MTNINIKIILVRNSILDVWRFQKTASHWYHAVNWFPQGEYVAGEKISVGIANRCTPWKGHQCNPLCSCRRNCQSCRCTRRSHRRGCARIRSRLSILLITGWVLWHAYYSMTDNVKWELETMTDFRSGLVPDRRNLGDRCIYTIPGHWCILHWPHKRPRRCTRSHQCNRSRNPSGSQRGIYTRSYPRCLRILTPQRRANFFRTRSHLPVS